MGIHAIIVIKNENKEYLQYFDEKWNSYLFMNCKLPNGDDSIIVKNAISNNLDIPIDKIKISLAGMKVHKKFSESAQKEKEYTHFFYNVNISEKLENSSFEKNGKKYKWFSYQDLLNDERIQKVNSDIVKFINEFNM